MKSWVDTEQGRARNGVCCVWMSVIVLVGTTSIYSSIRADWQAGETCFEATSSLDKVLRNELWKEHVESLLALVKA